MKYACYSLLILGVVSQFSFTTVYASGLSQAELFHLEELSSISERDPFPKTLINPINPITKQKTDEVLVGPAIKAHGKNFDYYRYVTFYDVEEIKDRIYSLPVHRQECYDDSAMFASYSYSFSFTASVTASVSFEGLGLSGTMSTSKSMSTSRTIQATGHLVADHIPYMLKHNWYGQTFIQTYDSKTKKTAFITKKSNGSNKWVQFFFPELAESKYPMDFEVKDADWAFIVERKLIKSCGK